MKATSDLLYPLDEFYGEEGLLLPPVERTEANEMPEPYQSLLVHRNDMTPTLERFYKRPIRLRVLKQNRRGGLFSRQVLLLLEGSERPVEFGAIKIDLERFPPPAQELILAGQRPLGSILSSERISHTSHPNAYIRVTSDATISRALGTEESCTLYGRQNLLLNSSQQTLAEIVEILPKIPDRGTC